MDIYHSNISIGGYYTESDSNYQAQFKKAVNFYGGIYKNGVEIATNIYSTDEVVVGTWIDGKPLYRRMFDFGTLPNNYVASKSHNIPNIKHIHINLGASFWCTNSTPYEESTGNSFSPVYISYISLFDVNKTQVIIQTVANGTNYHMLVCLEYTKTTD